MQDLGRRRMAELSFCVSVSEMFYQVNHIVNTCFSYAEIENVFLISIAIEGKTINELYIIAYFQLRFQNTK